MGTRPIFVAQIREIAHFEQEGVGLAFWYYTGVVGFLTFRS